MGSNVKDQILIIRHARSLHNIRASDDLDCGITDFGKEQAHRVGKFLTKHVNVSNSYFVTSPFLRCLQTASIIQEHARAQPGFCEFDRFNVDWRLREYINHSGREVSIPCRWSDYDFGWKNWDDGVVVFNDESNEVFLNRIHGFYNSLPDRSVVVTHGLPALALMHVATGTNVSYVPIWDHSLDNCSMTLIKNGRVVWMGRNLYHELQEDPYDKARPYDAADLLIPLV